jgi:hypothetical protein
MSVGKFKFYFSLISARTLLRSTAIAANVSRLGEVAEHKTSLELQMFKLKIKCQTKHKTAI